MYKFALPVMQAAQCVMRSCTIGVERDTLKSITDIEVVIQPIQAHIELPHGM